MTTKLSKEPEGRRRGVQSVEIGLRVLDAMATLGTASTLTSISQVVGMAPPQVHRYLQSLVAAGMAKQEGGSGRYDLGPAAVKLGLAALARTDAFRIVDTVISAFVEQSVQTVQIAALGPMGPTIVRQYAGRPAIMTSLAVGSLMPLLLSATGRVFLAFVPPAETHDLVERERAASPVDDAALAAMRADVQANGFSAEKATLIPGLEATAYPIFDLQGRAILVATALVPHRLAGVASQAAAQELGRLCGEISANLGWPGSH